MRQVGILRQFLAPEHQSTSSTPWYRKWTVNFDLEVSAPWQQVLAFSTFQILLFVAALIGSSIWLSLIGSAEGATAPIAQGAPQADAAQQPGTPAGYEAQNTVEEDVSYLLGCASITCLPRSATPHHTPHHTTHSTEH